MRTAKAVAGAGDDGDAVVEADSHLLSPKKPQIPRELTTSSPARGTDVGCNAAISSLLLQDDHRGHRLLHADHATAVLGERDLRAFHLARSRFAAQLCREFSQHRQARRE